MTTVSTHRGYQITTDGTTFYAAGARFNSAWSAIPGHTELTMHEAWMIDEDTGENYMLKQGWKALDGRED